MGTPAVPTVYTALGGVEIFHEAGEAQIYERIAALTADLVALADEAGFEMKAARDPRQRSGILLIRHDDAPGAVHRLAQQNIIVDHRAAYVRVSPHFYNTPDENRLFIEALHRC
jgi:selenocysteine lyase/cysteine desulfurase